MMKLKRQKKSLSYFSWSALTAVAIASVLSFQNCAAPVTVDDSSAASVSSTAILITSYPTNQLIALGQAFSVSLSASSATGAARRDGRRVLLLRR